jgi:hypothetical protein
VVVVGLALIAAAAFVLPPFAAAKRLRVALQSRDEAAVASLVDFKALHAHVLARVQQRVSDENRDRPLGGLREAFGNSLGERIVDRMTTPSGFIGVVCDHSLDAKAAPAPCSLNGKLGHVGFSSTSQFDVEVEQADGNTLQLRFSRYGLGWQLSDLVLPPQTYDQIRNKIL